LNNRSPLFFICIGNPYRKDDSVGIFLAAELKKRISEPGIVHQVFGEIGTVMDLMSKARNVIFVDAVSSGAEPGTIFRFDLADGNIPAVSYWGNTHGFSIPEAIDLAKILGQLPERVIVYAVEGKEFGAGEEMSEKVEASIPELLNRMIDEGHRLGFQISENPAAE
jgi:hydrogenase maturation protease